MPNFYRGKEKEKNYMKKLTKILGKITALKLCAVVMAFAIVGGFAMFTNIKIPFASVRQSNISDYQPTDPNIPIHWHGIWGMDGCCCFEYEFVPLAKVVDGTMYLFNFFADDGYFFHAPFYHVYGSTVIVLFEPFSVDTGGLVLTYWDLSDSFIVTGNISIGTFNHLGYGAQPFLDTGFYYLLFIDNTMLLIRYQGDGI